jgi:hypothetical protein
MDPLYCHRETLDRCRKGKRGSGGDPSDSLSLPPPLHLPRAFPLSLTLLLLSIAIAFLLFCCGFLFFTLVVPLPFYTRLNGSRSLSLSIFPCLFLVSVSFLSSSYPPPLVPIFLCALHPRGCHARRIACGCACAGWPVVCTYFLSILARFPLL